jgi:uncharacterized protein YndB with AHSA1/START domain
MVSRSIEIDAPAEAIFELLADPRQHPRFDGSDSVKAVIAGPRRLRLGARFGMRMRIGLPYAVPVRVVEFSEGRRIAWRHFARHIWRYELAELPGGGTRVTETFDYTRTSARAYERMGWPKRNAAGIEATLDRLKRLAETERAS